MCRSFLTDFGKEVVEEVEEVEEVDVADVAGVFDAEADAMHLVRKVNTGARNILFVVRCSPSCSFCQMNRSQKPMQHCTNFCGRFFLKSRYETKCRKISNWFRNNCVSMD